MDGEERLLLRLGSIRLGGSAMLAQGVHVKRDKKISPCFDSNHLVKFGRPGETRKGLFNCSKIIV